MQFQLMKDFFTGEVMDDQILYTDDDGVLWTVPEGNRMWQIYVDWLAEGNTPLPAA